jgi:hypothetical protein
MPDPFEALSHLDEGVPVHPLPAAEVRRRGDRLRRRRNTFQAVGAATAVAVFAAGGLLAGRAVTAGSPPVGPASQAPASPGPSTVSDGAWVSTIPPDFPLTLRLPRSGDAPEWIVSDQVDKPWENVPCADSPGTVQRFLGRVDARRVDARYIEARPPSAIDQRQLVLYPDSATAAQAVDGIERLTRACPPTAIQPGITQWRYQLERTTYGRVPGLLIGGGEYVIDGGRRGVGRSILAVVQRGNAVLLVFTSDQSSADPMDLTEPRAQRLRRVVGRLARSMCVFDPARCHATDAPPPTGAPASDTTVLGARGFSTVQLGMSAAQAQATGLVRLQNGPGNACATMSVLNDTWLRTVGMGYVSPVHGVVAIFARRDTQTPEGIHLGSSKADVLAAYPDGFYDSHRYWTVPLSPHAEYQIAMPDGRVEELGLVDPRQDCFG